MSAEFVSLAERLRFEPPPPEPVTIAEPDDDRTATPPDLARAVRDARLFRARLADALDDALARLVRELASDVLVRELRLQPCDLGALIGRVLERAPVVRVRVSEVDAPHVTGVAAVVDPSLDTGDAVVELAGGALDARLGVRLATVLEHFA